MKSETLINRAPKANKPGSKWKGMLVGGFLCAAGWALAGEVLHGRASFTGRATFTPVGTNQVALELNVSGNSTHLGRSHVRIQSLADTSGPIPKPVPPSTGVITAANGDTITFNLKWEIQESAPGVFDVLGPLEITGGTGRFRGATGTGEYGGRLDSNTGACSFAGTYDLLR